MKATDNNSAESTRSTEVRIEDSRNFNPTGKNGEPGTNVEIYRLLFESNPVPMWVFNSDSLRFLIVNEAAIKLSGYSREEFLAMKVTELRPPEDIAAYLQYLASAPVRSSPPVIWKHRTKDQRTIFVEVYNQPIQMGRESARLAIGNDVSDRLEAEEASRQSELMQRATIESALDCVVTIDESSTIIEFNPAAEQTFGWSSAEAIGRTLSETIIPPQFRERHARGMARLLATGEQRLIGKRIEITAMRASGEEFPVELTIVRVGTDRPWRFTAFLRDITERVSAREKLEAQEEQYRVLFETNPSAMWVYGLETLRILAVNDAAVRQYGYSRDELLESSLYDLRAPIEREALAKAISGPGSAPRHAGTWSHRRKDGSTLLVDVYSSATEFEGTPARIAVLVDVTERNEAQIALRKEREFLAAVVDNVSDGIVSCDANGVIALFNAATRELHGLPAEPIAADEWAEHFDLYLPDGKTLMRKEQIPLFRALEEGHVTDVEMVIAPLEGTPRRILASGQAFFNEQGGKIGAVVAMHDVTERQQAQERLRQSETALLLAQQVAHLGSWELELEDLEDVNNNALRWSDETFRIFGYEPNEIEITCETFFQMVHPDDRARVAPGVTALVRAGTPYSLDHRIILANGATRVVHEEASLIVHEKTKRPIKVAGTVQDITTRKAAEEKLREQAEMLNLAQDAIAIRGFDDRLITYWNKGAERLYGWTAKEAIGQPIDILYDGSGDNAAAKQTLEASGEFQGEIRQIAKNGRNVIVNARANLMRNSDGTARSVLSIATDITEHKKLQNQFMRAQRLESIGTLASGVAHDLNNILSPILMSVPLLRTPLSDESKEKLLSLVEQSAERGAAVVQQVLTFARGADGEKVLVQPTYLVKEIAQIAEETFPTNITVRSECPDNLWLVTGDATELHQVLLNLCVNARDAMPAGGRLSLKAENFEVDAHYASMTPGAHAGPHVLLTVSDTGTGIPSSVIDKIFDPFFTTKQEGKGTGLGLSTVLGIVRNHGGVVNVYSTAKGTTFRVLLPAAPGTHPASAAADPADLPRGQGETILIVDDEPVIREVAQALLSQSGYTVLTADDGPAALAIFARRSTEIRLVMTDFTMPLMSGMTLARALRKMDASTKIVISTGRDEDCNPAEAKSIGIEATLAKPYTQEKLLRTLDRLLHAGAPHIS